MDYVITVNTKDQATGFEEKIRAHRLGLLHRAFSVFIFNDRNELLLQQRAFSKYHSGGLWTNTCCSHPSPDEQTTIDAAHRRLPEEMGFDCTLRYWKSFTYRSVLDNELTEHEIDHLYTGTYNDAPVINPQEVNAWQYLSLQEAEQWMNAAPQEFTVWFRLIFPELLAYRTSVR